MIKYSVLLSGLICVSAALAEQAYIAPLAQKSMLLDVSVGNQVVVVGERGHILVESGNEFLQVEVPTTITLTAIDSVADNYWAVGHDASILKSSGSADQWRLVYSNVELDRPFLDVTFISAEEGLAVGGYGMFYRTADGGESWHSEQHASVLSSDDLDYLDSIKDDPEFYQEELSFILPHFNRINLDQGRLLLAGEAGLLAESVDNGYNWRRMDIDYQGSFFDLRSVAPSVLMAVGLRGNLFVRDELSDMEDWISIETCISTSLNSIIAAQDGVFVVGNNGVLLHIDTSKLFTLDVKAPNREGCQVHASITPISTDISSTISNAIVKDSTLLAITATGLKTIELSADL